MRHSTLKSSKWLLRALAALFVCIVVSVGLTGCDDDDDWWYSPGPGWTPLNDERFAGYWELATYNGALVAPGDRNYFYFNGYGSGYYYYLQNGQAYRENTKYFVQYSASGDTRYQINIQYQYDNPLTCDYYFNDRNSFTLQWYDRNIGEYVTYVYDRVSRAPW